MGFVDTRKLSEREPKPGWHGRFFDSQGMSFAYYSLDAGASLDEHSHPQEEVWNVVTGELEITVGADSFRAGPGQVALVPPNTAHSVRAIAKSSVIVVDAPLRGAVGGTGRAAFSIAFGALTSPALVSEIRNRGHAEGILRSIEIESGIAPSLPAPTRTEIPDGELPQRIAIAGGAVYRATHQVSPPTAAEREQLHQGKAVFYIRGVMLYEDAIGERHHTTFCRVLDHEQKLSPPAKPGYNYGD